MTRKSKHPASSAQPPAQTDTPFLLYAGDDEKVHVRVLIQGETLWLTQQLIAELFQTTKQNIGKRSWTRIQL